MGSKVIAFVPVRGGSKSIPLKNIKLLAGKPLVYWVLSSLERTQLVDEVVVATDSEEIKSVVNNFNLSKVKIYSRLPENAADTSSTESVMLEYIHFAQLPKDYLFILVQATSPLTSSTHFQEALEMYFSGKFNSMLTCVRQSRFYWNEDGTPINYDFLHRPRRQDFKGSLMENGAFYINTVGGVVQSKNRLSGKIGIYEMPEYTAVEIDEPDDWTIIEHLIQKYNKTESTCPKIKLFLSDVDGVLTDGGMYYSNAGEELKKFNTRDGMGFQLLREAGIKVGFITSENTKIVEDRAKKLKCDYLYQGSIEGGKLAVVKQICEKEQITLSEVAYIGDDINCYELLAHVGWAACPADACEKVKAIKNIHVLCKQGGKGVVREFAELVIAAAVFSK